MPEPGSLVSAEGLGRRFGDRWIFRRVSFDLAPGQVLAVTGRNGQGKSTLLKVVAGLLEPSEGLVRCRGTVGVSALDMALYPGLTCSEHLRFLASLSGASLDARASLAEVGLAGAEDRPAQALSTGMRARLKLAMALADTPDILILDEPTAALDDEGRSLVTQAVRRQKESGAVLMATNDRADLALATHELPLS